MSKNRSLAAMELQRNKRKAETGKLKTEERQASREFSASDDEGPVEFKNELIKVKYQAKREGKRTEGGEGLPFEIEKTAKVRSDHEADRDIKEYLRRLERTNIEMVGLLRQADALERTISTTLSKEMTVNPLIFDYDAKYYEVLNKIDENREIRAEFMKKESMVAVSRELTYTRSPMMNLSDIQVKNTFADKKKDELKDEMTIDNILDNIQRMEEDIRDVGFTIVERPAQRTYQPVGDGPRRLGRESYSDTADLFRREADDSGSGLSDSEEDKQHERKLDELGKDIFNEDCPPNEDESDEDDNYQGSDDNKVKPRLLTYQLEHHLSSVNTHDFIKQEREVYQQQPSEYMDEQEATFAQLKELIQSTKQDIEYLHSKKPNPVIEDKTLKTESNLKGNRVERVVALSSTKEPKVSDRHAFHKNWM